MSKRIEKKQVPSMDAWLKEAKEDPKLAQQGMFLVHNGIVRETPRAQVREGIHDGSIIAGLDFSFDADKVQEAVEKARQQEGIFHVRLWLNQGFLRVGEDIMYVLVGGDIRPHVIETLSSLVETIKTKCVLEVEHKQG